MSQDSIKQGESSKPRHSSPLAAPSNSASGQDDDQAPMYTRPNYMTVGSGSTSESAHRLAEMLDNDSGYGSVVDGNSEKAFNASLLEDRPTPPLELQGSDRSDADRKMVASHVLQLHYNQNKTSLARAITRTLATVQNLQTYNQSWPAHYPSVRAPTPRMPHADPRPGMHHTQSNLHTQRDRPKPRPTLNQRAETSMGESTSRAATHADTLQPALAEPRLVTPELAQDFSILKIDLKMDGMPQTEIIHSLRKDRKALAQLLDGQINKSVRHLSLLRERIEDTSSKVLVTGDLNAGKSTFCNALLRRKILPEDEQPCTSIFCEVLDVRDNSGLEEVHAIPIGSEYNRNDETTYKPFPLSDLERIVVDNEHYSQCKVYVKDVRTVDESLLNNGVLDIALIDAPGLNNDSIKTTAVFARQEEIDVVVFVVSAANHFTLSAREFIYDAAREKSYMFMVVNGYDQIKNKERCQEQILKQVAHLSPATFKESSELVHFVSSNAVPMSPSGEPNFTGSGADSGGSSSDPANDPEDDDPNDKGKGKERRKRQDFSDLEASLRRFVLEKRARSKLAPARTYLMNVLQDLGSLATHNRDMAQSELDRVSKELEELEPVLDQSKKARNEASDEIETSIEQSANDVFYHTRDTLNTSISDVSQRDLGVEYPGFWNAYEYAENIISAMLQEITDTVGVCEDHARGKTGEGVNSTKSLGLLHLGDAFIDLQFNADRMYRKKKDTLARQVEIDVDLWDFVDVTSLWDKQEKLAGTGMAMTVAGVLGTRLIGGAGWVDGVLGAARLLGPNNLRRFLVPGFIAAAIFGASYVVSSIPQSLPRRLGTKLANQLANIDFTNSNALRISSEVRKALKVPSDNLRIGLQRNFEQLQNKRQETNKIRSESETARKYFGNLLRDSGDIRGSVERVDVEGPSPGGIES